MNMSNIQKDSAQSFNAAAYGPSLAEIRKVEIQKSATPKPERSNETTSEGTSDKQDEPDVQSSVT
jgi:hypothetical protein